MTCFFIIADTDKSLSACDRYFIAGKFLCPTFPPLPEENVRVASGNSACDVTLALVK